MLIVPSLFILAVVLFCFNRASRVVPARYTSYKRYTSWG